MPQDQKKQPESSHEQTQTQPKVTSSRNRKQPFVKAQMINVLRGTIGLLENVVETLETEPARELPATAPELEFAFDTPVVTPELTSVLNTPVAMPEPEFAPDTPAVTPELESALNTPETTPEPESVPDISVTTPEPESVERIVEPVVSELMRETSSVAPESTAPIPVKNVEPMPSKLTQRSPSNVSRPQPLWTSFLAKVRSILPEAVSEKLSDWVLTGAIAGIIVALVFATTTLLPQNQAQVAEAPAKAPESAISTPSQLKAPKPEQAIEVAPPPAPELTPEQSLIAGIQERVAEITNQFGSGLIQSIEANFLGSRLTVKVNDDWYNLKETQQNQLTDEMLRRANELDFSKLEITDLEGTLVARSPVVGSHMVILKRQGLAAN